nr:glycosyltransferase family 4 protein [Robertkochia marina]
MEVLQSIFGVPAHILVYHPLFAEDGLIQERNELPGYQHRADIVFIGNFFHEPNADAIKCLEEGVWEEIHRRLPGVKLHIYGAYMPESLKTSSVLLKRNVVFHGRAEDVDAVMQQARVCLVPLRFGAGLKGKLIRAMENGLPSVTTPVGAEGISDKTNWGGAVVPLGEDFTAAVITLYTDKESWIKAVEQGFRIIDHRFRRESYEKTFAGRINACMLDLSFHRSGNFTGQMLMDQRNMAARYLSKYIMAKNTNSR